jgi:hypothetical protein
VVKEEEEEPTDWWGRSARLRARIRDTREKTFRVNTRMENSYMGIAGLSRKGSRGGDEVELEYLLIGAPANLQRTLDKALDDSLDRGRVLDQLDLARLRVDARVGLDKHLAREFLGCKRAGESIRALVSSPIVRSSQELERRGKQYALRLTEYEGAQLGHPVVLGLGKLLVKLGRAGAVARTLPDLQEKRRY